MQKLYLKKKIETLEKQVPVRESIKPKLTDKTKEDSNILEYLDKNPDKRDKMLKEIQQKSSKTIDKTRVKDKNDKTR